MKSEFQIVYDKAIENYKYRRIVIAERLTARKWSFLDIPITFEDRVAWEADLQYREREISRMEIAALKTQFYRNSDGKLTFYVYNVLNTRSHT